MALKGSIDQHSFAVSQFTLNFFITQSHDLDTISINVNDMSRYYLNGFALGTMKALSESDTSIIYIIIDKLSVYKLMVLIELFKRACRILHKFNFF
jgi:hypothetical protein